MELNDVLKNRRNTKNQNGLLQICSKLVQDIQIILRKFV